MTITRPGTDLRSIVQALAADPAAWKQLVRHDRDERQFELLHRDDDLEIWLVCWMPGHDTGFHDHDASAAAITVVAGEIAEDRLAVDGPDVDRCFAAGQTLTVRASDIHRVRHTGEEPSVTIHAYSPPLVRMGRYEVGPNGTLQRHAQDAQEELRPLTAA